MAGECKDERLLIPEHKHVELLDQGGKYGWKGKVNTDVVSIFSVAEICCLSSSTKGANNIDTKSFAFLVLKTKCRHTESRKVKPNQDLFVHH